jgi:hypothetical protein
MPSSVWYQGESLKTILDKRNSSVSDFTGKAEARGEFAGCVE